jgi:hypothetical protein
VQNVRTAGAEAARSRGGPPVRLSQGRRSHLRPHLSGTMPDYFSASCAGGLRHRVAPGRVPQLQLWEDAERWLRGEPSRFFEFRDAHALAALWAEFDDPKVAVWDEEAGMPRAKGTPDRRTTVGFAGLEQRPPGARYVGASRTSNR